MNKIDKLKEAALRALSDIAKKRVITGDDEYIKSKPEYRALFSYLVHPLLPPKGFRDQVMFSNRGICQEIARVLNEMGYVVDIVNYDNSKWNPDKNYDLFIGHAGINFERISRALPGNVPRIYFSTGIYWQEWNRCASQRINDLAKRKGIYFKPDRSISMDEEYANREANGIICLGNEHAVKTYSKFQNVIGINNAVFPITSEDWRKKDYGLGKNHFLFFSGRGNVHKGLNLLLEAFENTDLHLHVCQHIDPEFKRIFSRELTELPNVHLHGFVRMRSRKFEELAKQCNWIISATCAEGQPGAVLEGMGYGLIPILPDSANIDFEGWGFRLENFGIETIREIVKKASELEPEECMRQSIGVSQLIRENYSVERFRRSFSSAVAEILSNFKVVLNRV